MAVFLGGAVVYVLSMTQEAETEVKQAAPQLAPCAVRTAPAIGTIHGKRCAGPVRDHENPLQRCAKSQVPELRRRAASAKERVTNISKNDEKREDCFTIVPDAFRFFKTQEDSFRPTVYISYHEITFTQSR